MSEHPRQLRSSVVFSLHLILKMIAISGFLTALECTKFVFGRGSAPDPAGGAGAYSAPPNHLAGLRGPTSKGRRDEGKGRKGIGEGRERERKR